MSSTLKISRFFKNLEVLIEMLWFCRNTQDSSRWMKCFYQNHFLDDEIPTEIDNIPSEFNWNGNLNLLENSEVFTE